MKTLNFSNFSIDTLFGSKFEYCVYGRVVDTICRVSFEDNFDLANRVLDNWYYIARAFDVDPNYIYVIATK